MPAPRAGRHRPAKGAVDAEDAVDGDSAAGLRLLRASPLFGGLPLHDLRAVATQMQTVRFPAGALLMREGDAGDVCYLIRSGRAGVVTRDLIGEVRAVAILGPGATVGEIALVGDQPRGATVRAMTALTALAMDRQTFVHLETISPAFTRHARHYAERRMVETYLRQASPFARIGRAAMERVVERLRPVRVLAGRDVIRQDDEADSFFLVRAGRVEVIKDGHPLGELGPGDCFGEVALLTGGRRTATVRAVTDTRLLSLDRGSFQAILREGGVGGRLGELVRIRHGAAAGQRLLLPDPVATLMPFLEPSRHQRYSLLLIAGIIAFAGLTALAAYTGVPALVYAALVVGALVGPVLYVTYLAESNVLPESPVTLAVAFGLGAALGLPLAILLERFTGAMGGRLLPAMLVALIEEPCKVLGVLWLLRQRSSRFQMDGVIFGAASGMGFAAFETMLFGLSRVTMVGPLLATLWLRTLLAPFGHGTWTAINCAILWKEKGSGAPRWDRNVAAAFAATIVLHGLWDWQPLPGALGLLWFLGLGAIGLLALRAIVHRALSEEQGAVLALNPEVAQPRAARLQRILCRVCGQVNLAGAHYCVRCGTVLRIRQDAVASMALRPAS